MGAPGFQTVSKLSKTRRSFPERLPKKKEKGRSLYLDFKQLFTAGG